MAVAVRTSTVTGPLRPGPSRLARAQVEELQRNRLMAAAVEAVAELGYARLTVGSIIGRARVSRKTFYDIFCDREGCFLAVCERALASAREIAAQAYAQEPGWREGVRSAVRALLVFMDEEPVLAKLCVVDALIAGESILEARCEVLEELARAIDEGRTAPGAAHDPPAVTAEVVVGGILAVLHSRLLEGDREPLSELSGALMSMIVLPYLGPRAARQELEFPSVPAPPRDAAPLSADGTDPLNGLRFRLTYRTVCTLMAIAESPGASNREIAEAAGIVDQGQISKLLGRLEGLGLIENHGAGQPKGAANAWRLTPRGAQLERAARPR